MPDYDRRYLAARANELGFVRDTLEKVYRLSDILEYLNRNSLLKESLALKGGTAINFAVFNLPRLSVDIDLDYASPVSLEEMLAGRAAVNADLLKHLQSAGYTLGAKSRNSHSLDSWVLEYQNAGGNRDNIKIEVNYSMRAHFLPTEQRKIVTDLFASDFEVNSLSPIELYSSKIAALLDRTAARDLYDVYNMVHFGLFDESQYPLLRKGIAFYAALSSEHVPLGFTIEVVDRLTEQRIKTDLMPVLRRKDAFVLKTAQAEVKAFLGDLLVMTESDRVFLTLLEKGIYSPERLFDDAEIVERVKAHPMALWKTRAIQRSTQSHPSSGLE